jgi:outer membrane murein-binding lipoprotein Lpp
MSYGFDEAVEDRERAIAMMERQHDQLIYEVRDLRAKIEELEAENAQLKRDILTAKYGPEN